MKARGGRWWCVYQSGGTLFGNGKLRVVEPARKAALQFEKIVESCLLQLGYGHGATRPAFTADDDLGGVAYGGAKIVNKGGSGLHVGGGKGDVDGGGNMSFGKLGGGANVYVNGCGLGDALVDVDGGQGAVVGGWGRGGHESRNNFV